MTISNDPFTAFAAWRARAERTEHDVTAMTLATADARGRPSARMVLLKGVDDRGFVFYTNRTSRKGHELAENAFAALVFHWATVEQQVRVEGSVERTSDADSDAYFATRPRGSQIGAWASQQSAELASMQELEARVAEIEARYSGGDVPRPPHWGGFRVVPDRVELWQGKPSRLHERVVYERAGAIWKVTRLYP